MNQAWCIGCNGGWPRGNPTMNAAQTLEPTARIVETRRDRSGPAIELPLPAPAEMPPAPKRRRAPMVLAGLVAAAAAGGAYLYVSQRGVETTDNAQVEG